MRYDFGEMSLDTDARQLRRGEHFVHLSPKAMELLLVLINERPRAVPRRRLGAAGVPPCVPVTAGSVAKDGAKVGAWSGGLFGLLIGAAFLILPGVGPVVIAGPLAAASLGGVEGALGGAAFMLRTPEVTNSGMVKKQNCRALHLFRQHFASGTHII